MVPWFRIVAVASVAVVIGCAGENSHPEIAAAYKTFVASVKARDAGRLYDIGPQAFRDRVDQLYADLGELVATVEREYPKVEVEMALHNLGADLLDGGTGGRDFLVGLVDFTRVEAGADLDTGLGVESMEQNGDDAIVETVAGEVFNFVREDGEWRCTTLAVQFDRAPSIKRLRSNMQAIKKNLDAWKKATRETTDMTRPEGVFNVLAHAVKRGARMKAFELLDAASAAQITKAATLAAQLQAKLERRFPRKKHRHAYLVRRKLAWLDQVAGGKSLFAALWDAGILAADLPLTADVTIRQVDVRKDDTAVVMAATDKGQKRFTFRRTPDSRWRLISLEPVLQREAVRRVEAELKALSTAVSAPTSTAP